MLHVRMQQFSYTTSDSMFIMIISYLWKYGYVAMLRHQSTGNLFQKQINHIETFTHVPRAQHMFNMLYIRHAAKNTLKALPIPSKAIPFSNRIKADCEHGVIRKASLNQFWQLQYSVVLILILPIWYPSHNVNMCNLPLMFCKHSAT